MALLVVGLRPHLDRKIHIGCFDDITSTPIHLSEASEAAGQT